jgi:osmotically-inducible protein OsmY
MTDDYTCAAVQRALAEDAAISELGIDVVCRDDRVILSGSVESAARREEIARRVAEVVPDRGVVNEITVAPVYPPRRAEEVR